MKKNYEEKLAGELQKWDEQIARLEARLASASPDEKRDYGRKIELLRHKHDEAIKKLDEIRTASDDAWEHLKEGIEKLWQELKMMLVW